jgi:hypothetical protein
MELFGLWGMNQENLDPSISQLGRFWAVPMQSSFLVTFFGDFPLEHNSSNPNHHFALKMDPIFEAIFSLTFD